jgi:hypothetical protein
MSEPLRDSKQEKAPEPVVLSAARDDALATVRPPALAAITRAEWSKTAIEPIHNALDGTALGLDDQPRHEGCRVQVLVESVGMVDGTRAGLSIQIGGAGSIDLPGDLRFIGNRLVLVTTAAPGGTPMAFVCGRAVAQVVWGLDGKLTFVASALLSNGDPNPGIAPKASTNELQILRWVVVVADLVFGCPTEARKSRSAVRGVAGVATGSFTCKEVQREPETMWEKLFGGPMVPHPRYHHDMSRADYGSLIRNTYAVLHSGSGSVSRSWILALPEQPDHVLDRPPARGHPGCLGGRLTPEAHMRPAEVVVHEVDRHGGSQVLDLLGEGVRQAGEPPHAHADGQVLPLNVTGAHQGRVGPPLDELLGAADALGRAVALLGLLGRPVDLDQHGVGCPATEGILNGREVHGVPVRRDLDPLLGAAAGEIPAEGRRCPAVPRADQERGAELGVRVDSDERPHVAVAENPSLALGDVLLLRVAESPYLVYFQALTGQLPQGFILVAGAGGPKLKRELGDGVLRHASHADGGADRAPLDQGGDHGGTALTAQYVCHTDHYACPR